MKIKSILVGVASLAFAVSSYAQGTINFVNSATTLVTINGPATSGNTVNASTATYGTRIQLYYQPGTVAQPAAITASSGIGAWELVGAVGTNIASNGRFSVGSMTLGNDAGAGTSVWLMAVAWSGASAGAATKYADLGSALADPTAYLGVSTVFSLVSGNPNGTPSTTPTSTAGIFPGVTLIPVPEPTTIALAGLGAASLLLFRRRK